MCEDEPGFAFEAVQREQWSSESVTLYGAGNDGFIYYAFDCTHYTGTGNGTGDQCHGNGLHAFIPVPGPGPVQCV